MLNLSEILKERHALETRKLALQRIYENLFLPLQKEYKQIEEGALKNEKKVKLELVANRYNAQLAMVTEEESK